MLMLRIFMLNMPITINPEKQKTTEIQWFFCGEYRSRTDDLLAASQTL